MSRGRAEHSWYLPGRLYDLAFSLMFRGLRRKVARTVERERLYPWLDVCCGTGDQLRRMGEVATGPAASGGGEPNPGLALGLDLDLRFVRYARARAPRLPLICGDAARLPFRDGSMRAISVSFGLHDKGAKVRSAILAEARRTLAPGGRLIAVDFENAWDGRSKAGALFSGAIERLAGGEHYRNGRDFLRRGGLRAFLRENGFLEVERRNVRLGALGIVVARVNANGLCAPPSSE
jgi:ubiquinone/menaquinone biosynthesis C-methylase UbiE